MWIWLATLFLSRFIDITSATWWSTSFLTITTVPLGCLSLVSISWIRVHLVLVFFDKSHISFLSPSPLQGTDSSNIIPVSWSDLCLVISPKDHPGEGCRLGLHEVQESARLLSQHYLEKRTSSGQTLYSLIAWEYIPLVGQFLHLLCQALVSMWADNVAMDAAKPSAGMNMPVRFLLFQPSCNYTCYKVLNSAAIACIKEAG